MDAHCDKCGEMNVHAHISVGYMLVSKLYNLKALVWVVRLIMNPPPFSSLYRNISYVYLKFKYKGTEAVLHFRDEQSTASHNNGQKQCGYNDNIQTLIISCIFIEHIH